MDTNPRPPALPAEANESTPPQPPPRRRKRRGLRILLTLAILVAAAVVAHVIWGVVEKRRLEAQLAVYRAAGEPTTVEELNRWPAAVSGPGSGENALAALRTAGDAVDETTQAYRDYVAAERLLPLTDAEAAVYEAVLKENPGALAAVERAVTMSRIDWELNMTSPMFADLGDKGQFNALRRLTNLLQADAMLAHRSGDEARALRRAGQILFVSRAMGHHPTLVGYIMSLGMTAQAAGLAADVAPDLSLSPPDARRAAAELVAQLLDERAMTEARHRAFVGERVLQLDAVHALTDGGVNPMRIRGFSSGVDDDGAAVRFAIVGRVMRPVFYENGKVMSAYMTDVIRVLPESPDWPAYQAKAPPWPKGRRSTARDLLLQVLLPSLDRAITLYYRCAAGRRLAATCLAARLYAADHGGRYPEALRDLVPDYLPAVPPDPFSKTGATLLYVNPAADPEKPRVYSVDENGDDNGGVEPDPRLPRRDYDRLSDEIRHLKRQPRPKPVRFPPGTFPGLPPGVSPPPDHDDGDASDDGAPDAQPQPEESAVRDPAADPAPAPVAPDPR